MRHIIYIFIYPYSYANSVQHNSDSSNIEANQVFDDSDAKIKQDTIRLIAQFLNEQGLQASKMVLFDEANLQAKERDERQLEFKRLRQAILDGDWAEVDKLTLKPIVSKNHKSFLYAIYKQLYLEFIDRHETQKAFTHLVKRLKPLEQFQTTPNEFYDLCYLLTAKSVQEAPLFKSWEGIAASREQLVEQLENMMEIESADREGSVYIPPHRLTDLLKQAFAYQMESSRYKPTSTPQIKTLLQDYHPNCVPKTHSHSFAGHSANVKCVKFVGEKGNQLLSGGSDQSIRLWDSNTAECISVMSGHSGRIWDLAIEKTGAFCASASGDSLIKIWDLKRYECINSISSSISTDVYSVEFHPSGKHIASGGYDKIVHLFDIEQSKAVKSLSGHSLSVTKVVFSPLGNLIISASKDNTIKFWDIVSGLCIKTLSSHLGEVTCVDVSRNGMYLLSSSKDNSNRIWDIRMLRPIQKLKGHQNTSKNFIRAEFAGDSMVVGGSEDGAVCIWDSDKGDLIQRLKGHAGVVYSATWNAHQSLLASCSDDQFLKTWV